MRISLAFVFLILANFILMAHHAIPHHHHHGQACMQDGHCQTGENHSGEDGSHTNEHNHDGDPLSTHCILKQDIIRPYNNLKLSAESDIVSSGPVQGLSSLMTVNPIRQLLSLNPQLIFFHEKALSQYTYFASTSGLRAPPMV
jgi:hypothetical protein